MKNFCRMLLMAGAVMATACCFRMTVRAAATVTDISQMVSLGTISGSYELGDNIGDGSYYVIGGNATINLASFRLNADLRVENNSGDRLTINGNSDGELSRVYVSRGRVTQNGGKVSFIGVAVNGEYSLTGGEVAGGEIDDGTFRQSGGTVSGDIDLCYNFANIHDGTYIISGGTVTGNINMGNGTLTVSGGDISGNIILDGGTLTITSGTISGNITVNGGALQNNGGTITGNIIDNTGSGSSSTGSSSSGSSDSSDKKSTHKKHTTASADYDYSEQNGQFVYGGLVDGVFAPTTMIPASAYPKFNSFLVKKLQATEAGSMLSVNADPWTSINKAVADAFTEKGDIGLAIKYTQGGVPLQVTIPAGTNLSEQLDENGYIGFPKLAQLYGAAPVTE